MKIVSDEELESLRPKPKFQWVQWKLMEHDSLNWAKQPFIFQCLRCNVHYTHKNCSNCGHHTFVSGNNATGIFCEQCEKGFSSWKCENCGTENPVANTRYLLRNQGCFIATAVYGSENAPEVLVLRSFRDNILALSKIGRILVSFYYFLSPSVAHLLNQNWLLRDIVRKCIVHPIVNLCHSKLRKNQKEK